MKKINWRFASMFAVLGSASAISPVWGGGVEVKTWSAESIGQANAGSSVQFGNVEFMTRNPALLAYMTRPQAAASATYIIPKIKFKNSNSTLGAANLTGGNGGNGGKSATVPAIYLGGALNNHIKLGLAITAPWGLKTSYSNGWVGRYWNLNSSMKTLNINPAFGFKCGDKWAFGAGLQVQYMEVKLTQAINTGAFVGLPQAADTNVRLKGHDWGYGLNLGATYEPFKHTRVGLSYRSPVHYRLTGDKVYTFPNAAVAAALGANPDLINSKIEAAISTPETILLGAAHDLTHEWTVLGELTWTRWSRFTEIKVRTPNIVGAANAVTPLKWSNTVAYSLGANYKPEKWKGWTWRAGAAYDPTPIDDQYRTPGIPDTDRYWLATGVGYQAPAPAHPVMAHLKFNLSYAHEFTTKAKSALVSATKGNLVGKYSGGVDMISAQVVYSF